MAGKITPLPTSKDPALRVQVELQRLRWKLEENRRRRAALKRYIADKQRLRGKSKK